MSAVPPTTDDASPRPELTAELDTYFQRQPTRRSELPDPLPLLENLSRSVVEVLAGAREVEQIARWLSEGVYAQLLRRSVLASRGRSARRTGVTRPVYALGGIRVCEPADGVIEATVLLHGRIRTRALAIRLEGLDTRWRATALHVL
jgi:Family of unknown function (DUF6459)